MVTSPGGIVLQAEPACQSKSDWQTARPEFLSWLPALWSFLFSWPNRGEPPYAATALPQHLCRGLVAQLCCLFKAGTSRGLVAEHVVEHAQVVLGEECPAALNTLVFVSFTQGHAALEGIFDPREIRDVFGRVTADQL